MLSHIAAIPIVWAAQPLNKGQVSVVEVQQIGNYSPSRSVLWHDGIVGTEKKGLTPFPDGAVRDLQTGDKGLFLFQWYRYSFQKENSQTKKIYVKYATISLIINMAEKFTFYCFWLTFLVHISSMKVYFGNSELQYVTSRGKKKTFSRTRCRLGWLQS